MSETQQWTVVLDITPEHGAVRAVARLLDRSATRLVGEGVARTGPVERVAPAAGAEVAAARALHQLSERLVAAARLEYDIAVRRRQAGGVHRAGERAARHPPPRQEDRLDRADR